MATNDQAALIVRLEAKFDKLEKQLKQVGVLADNAVKDIEDKFSKVDPQIGGAGGIARFTTLLRAGIVAAAVAAIAKIAELKTQLDELQKTADFSGQSLETVVRTLKGLGDPQGGGAGIENLTSLIDRMQRGEVNKLSEFFTLNNVAKESIKTANDALAELAARMASMTPAQARDLGRSLGITDDFTTKLRDVGARFDEMSTVIADKAVPAYQAVNEKIKELSKAFDDLNTRAQESGGWFQFLIRKLPDFNQQLDPIIVKLNQIARLQAGLPAEGPPALGTSPSGASLPAARLAVTLPSVAPKSAAESERQLSAEERLSIEKKKQAELAQVEFEALGKTNIARAEAKALVEFNAATERDVARGIKLSTEEQQKFRDATLDAARKEAELEKATAKVRDILQTMESIASDVFKGFVNDLREGVKTATALKNMLDRIADKLLDKSISLALNAMLGQGSAGEGLIKGLIAGNRQGGGPVSAGKMYVVGEHGPELVAFGRNGMVLPNAATPSGAGGVSVQIINNGAQVSTQSSRQPDGGTNLRIMIDAAVAELAGTPGSNTNRALRMGTSPLVRRS